MRRIFILVAIVVLTGCVQSKVQEMPVFNTADGKFHARECQLAYAACVSACRQEVGGIPALYQRKANLENCQQILEDCYKTCE